MAAIEQLFVFLRVAPPDTLHLATRKRDDDFIWSSRGIRRNGGNLGALYRAIRIFDNGEANGKRQTVSAMRALVTRRKGERYC